MPNPPGLITLLTDFGDQDSFVASMKGVILTINPQARFVDLSHQVSPHSIEEAAYLLNSCYRYFPEGTVHVAVVDPGVGSARRPLLVKTASYYFLGPDNGLFSYVLMDEDEVEVRKIENQQYRLKSVGPTFEGRDLFASSAAWLTKGVPASSFGQVIHDPIRFSVIEPSGGGNRLVGRVEHVDRFGNLISNLTLQHLEGVHPVAKNRQLSVRIGEQIIEGLVVNYSEGKADQPSALINSDGRLEIFVKEASAAGLLKIGRGTRIEVS
ncbi:MAG TPA: SAM-dependent chlorinase/fluorinase [Nitrospiraceae bacterium]|nr:SAM-dependent chlorinase/fluorinase [Nitrospiraceae bacterium]